MGSPIRENIQPNIDQESADFKKMLFAIAEKVGSSNVPELQLLLLNLKCPDGSPFIQPRCIQNHRTIKDIFISLLESNLCTPRDLDVLIHILSGLKRQDLLSFISTYVPTVTIGKPLGAFDGSDEQRIYLTVELHSALKVVDIGVVSAIKQELCMFFTLKKQPYLMQYIGWKSSPVTLFFQLPSACMLLAVNGLQGLSVDEMSASGILCIKVYFNKTNVFCKQYD